MLSKCTVKDRRKFDIIVVIVRLYNAGGYMQAQEKLKLQSKELKDALQQRKLAMSEYTEVTDKLSELRQHKQKLSRQVLVYVTIYL
jgi:hypothetical protein